MCLMLKKASFGVAVGFSWNNVMNIESSQYIVKDGGTAKLHFNGMVSSCSIWCRIPLFVEECLKHVKRPNVFARFEFVDHILCSRTCMWIYYQLSLLHILLF